MKLLGIVVEFDEFENVTAALMLAIWYKTIPS
jgi:hypothetical protein